MSNYTPVEVKIWGDFACFTRPEMKVERVSYELPPPSAARGMLEAIFWKPQFFWVIKSISVLKPIRRMSILRSEVKSTINTRGFPKEDAHYYADQDRAQRHSLILRDVAYIIRAEPIPYNGNRGERAKYREQFRRRVRRGQCMWQPYLGCREFSAFFSEVDENDIPLQGLSMELGNMLFEMNYRGKGQADPLFFPASIEQGTVQIPPEQYARVSFERPQSKPKKTR